MDEQELTELFRDAADGGPPASFDVGGVRTASARATAKRRTSIALGSTLAAVLVLGGVAVGTDVFTTNSADSAAAGSAESGSSLNLTPFQAPDPRLAEVQPAPGTNGGLPPKSLPEDPSTQGDEPPGSVGRPSVDSTSRGCVEVDRELAVALADELPVAQGTQPSPAVADCPVGARGAGFLVRDGGVYGVVSVVLVPPGKAIPATSGESRPASGGTVYVFSEPERGSVVAPFEGELGGIAERIAAKF